MALQRAGVCTVFSQQLAGMGAPTGLEGLTQQALTGGQQGIAGAGASPELNQLAQLFGGDVSGMLGAQPSQQIGQLGSRALALGQQGVRRGCSSRHRSPEITICRSCRTSRRWLNAT